MVRIVFAILLPGAPLAAAGTTAPSTNDLAWVNLREIAPTIRIELRYATARNITHSALYPCGMQPMVRGGVARCLIAAEKTLRRYNCGLKSGMHTVRAGRRHDFGSWHQTKIT